MKTILQAKGLSIGYQKRTVAESINLTANQGELIALLGKNGAGKSTLIKSITGVITPLKGEVDFFEKSLNAYGRKEMAKKVSLVLTQTIGLGNITVYAIVSLGRFPYTSWLGQLGNDDKDIIARALKQTGLEGFEHRHVGELSDGERQKVMIARALVQDTPMIVLDEPTTHLDIPNRLEVFFLLKELAHQYNKTIIVSTHELDLALEFADKLWLVNQGKAFEGLAEDLVLKGKFEGAFGNKGLRFDYEEAKFKKSVDAPSQNIKVTGDKRGVIWTLKALNKWTVLNRNTNLSFEVMETNQAYKWRIEGVEELFDSLHELKNYLKTINEEF